MGSAVSLLKVVALLVDVPEHGLLMGQVGTVIEALDDEVFEVEFSDVDGRTYGQVALPAQSLLVLHHRKIPLL